MCLERLKSVNMNATKALSLVDSPGNESRRVADIILATKVSSVVGVN